MRLVIQRCLESSVSIEGEIKHGVVVFVGFTKNDSEKEINYLVDKLINLRIFDDESGVMNLSLQDVKGSILSISQFTLYADTSHGRRPSYIKALNGKAAKKLYDLWNRRLTDAGVNVATGVFGADMKVNLINDGPVTITIEKEGEICE